MARFVWFVGGLIFGLVGGAVGLAHLQSLRVVAEDQIIFFPPKTFHDLFTGQSEYVAISGTMTGDGQAYPNNTYGISCWSELKQCYVAETEQIGPRQINGITGPNAHPITKWTADEIVAQDEPNQFACYRTTITIDRRAQQALWVDEPINLAKPICKYAETKIRKYSLEDSPSWKKKILK